MVFGKKLSRGRKAREALFKSLVKALVEHGKITTTRAKAKSIVGQVDKLINLAKQEDLSTRRRVLAYLGNDRKTTDSIFKIAPKFTGRKGGYIKMVNLLPRRGDMAQLVRIEWTDLVLLQGKKEKKTEKKVEELAEAQKRTEKKVEELAEKSKTKK